ncbi:MAG: O-methyltransferase [Clostridiales bacterium]|jgi:predicted O-methyltransferase YrrM|nr:O-methyltransferase [Clostridiales bacterium]
MMAELAQFLDGLRRDLPGNLAEFHRRTVDAGLPVISRDVADFLSLLLTLRRPQNVLEIGCGVGFSAALFAEFTTESSKITTIDRYEFMTSRAKSNFEKLGLSAKIRLIEDDAANALPALVKTDAKFDFIFMDCGKGQYLRFWPHISRLLGAGGLFCADDIFQGGNIARAAADVPRRHRTTHRNLREFLHMVMADKALKSVILPIGDGLLVSLKEDTIGQD